MAVAREQTIRVLGGRFALRRATAAGTGDADLLAVVFGPDGRTEMIREEDGTWAALWNGDDAHDPDATGMLSAIVAPLAESQIPVWVASSFDGDLVLVPADQLPEAAEALRRAGHRVNRP
jgi:hypothetical protein